MEPLTVERVGKELDSLAEEIGPSLAGEDTAAARAMIGELEVLRRQIDAESAGLIAAHYGFLQVKEEFSQAKARADWIEKYFSRLFAVQWSGLAALFGLGIASGFAQSVHVPTAAGFCRLAESAWWGAVGASTASLHALYAGRMDGRLTRSMGSWLIAKPLLGAVLGLLAGITAQVAAGAAIGLPAADGQTPDLFAFFAGVAERRFLSFLQALTGLRAQDDGPSEGAVKDAGDSSGGLQSSRRFPPGSSRVPVR